MTAARRQAPEGGWQALKADELRGELEARGLSRSGKKDELVARLDEDDASAEEAAARPETAEEEAPPEEAAAETATTEPTTAAPRPDGALVVSATAKYVRSAPRKARLVMDHIRGKNVEQAQAMLRHAPRAVSGEILKLLNSAVANAESSYELGPDELRIVRAFVDEGPTIKRYRPRARGRATRILKRTSHMTIELTTEGNGG
jgi:ribosomal protein L22